MKVISIRENPEYAKTAIAYFQKQWASEASMMVYEDCINSAIHAEGALPQWYLLYEEDGDAIIGCAGLITNDFISRMDLYPWLCALYIEPEHRGKMYSGELIARIKADTKAFGYPALYLCTDHEGLYEKFGFEHIAMGYHPWGERSKIYKAHL